MIKKVVFLFSMFGFSYTAFGTIWKPVITQGTNPADRGSIYSTFNCNKDYVIQIKDVPKDNGMISAITCNTVGTTNTGDIVKATLWVAAGPNDSNFGNATVWAEITNPNGVMYFDGTDISMVGGDDWYFWLTYDISSNATIGNLLDANCTLVENNDGFNDGVASTTDPAGSRQIADNCNTGIPNALQEMFSIFPNPVSSKIAINFSFETKNVSIKLIDVLGKEVMKVDVPNGTKSFFVEKGELKTGIYFMEVISEKSLIANKKLIIR